MKRLLLLLGAGALLAIAVWAQTQCHDEMICTGVNGCRWVTFCNPAPPLPRPPQPPQPPPLPRPPQCHDEMICTGVNGCRWVTICN